jgi:L,D-peptidoglycan transpeptidase YkuD (ErfK/YbiS/YcfS/YnhG family)
VSVDQANMLRVLRWLDPAKAPRITMAPKEWLASA